MKNIQLYFSSHSAAVGIQGGGGQPASNQSQIAGGKPNRNEAVHTHLNENGNIKPVHIARLFFHWFFILPANGFP